MTRITAIAVALSLLVLVPASSGAATPAALNEAGKAAYARGDFESAARLFGEAAAGAPGEPLYHYHRGVALAGLGRLDEARAAYEHALSLKPSPDMAATIKAALREFGTRQPLRRAREAEGETIALEARYGVWFAEVTINGRRRARFVVDTGATSCTISATLAAELGIRLTPDVPTIAVMTMNGRATGRLVSLDSIRIGDAEVRNVPTIVHATDAGIDGLLGNTFLAHFAVTLDAERRVLHLRPRP